MGNVHVPRSMGPISSTDALSVPVVQIPTAEQMSIKLVRQDKMEQLDAARSNQRFWIGWLILFLGGILAIVTNWLTDLPITITVTSLYLMAFCVFAVIATGLAALRAYLQAKELNVELDKEGINIPASIFFELQTTFPSKTTQGNLTVE